MEMDCFRRATSPAPRSPSPVSSMEAGSGTTDDEVAMQGCRIADAIDGPAAHERAVDRGDRAQRDVLC